MTPELDQYIREKYPLIFSSKCELAIGDGWFDIIDMLCGNIQNHINNIADQRKYAIKWNEEVTDPDNDWSDKLYLSRKERKVPELVEQVVATQTKEKFGTLRFYCIGGDYYIRGLEAMAESMSAVICEDCGCPGTRRSTKKNRWMRVLCDSHALEQGYIEDES